MPRVPLSVRRVLPLKNNRLKAPSAPGLDPPNRAFKFASERLAQLDHLPAEGTAVDLSPTPGKSPSPLNFKVIRSTMSNKSPPGSPLGSRSCKSKRRRLMPLLRLGADPSASPISDFLPEESTNQACSSVLITIGRKSQQRLSRVKKTKSNSSLLPQRKALACHQTVPQHKAAKTAAQQSAPLKRTVVCTYMHHDELERMSEAISKLGDCEMNDNVSSKTTHVVCGDEKRTMNLLRGIALGCWVVKSSWIVKSLEAGHWIDEEAHEIQTFPGIRKCRVTRETLGGRCDIFNNQDIYYVAFKTRPPHSDLKNLLHLCGAKVVSSARYASVVVTPQKLGGVSGAVQVNEMWVLDSIQENMLQEKQKYLL